MSVRTLFSIKDLENLSGVKAHTIRIWEKRYNLLQPARTDTNIRQYDLENLKRLLNVTFLYEEGYKISKIAKLTEEEIVEIIQDSSEEKRDHYSLQAFKTAMFDFDYRLFTETYNALLKEKSFEETFLEIFIPLLNEIGMLWHTGTIDPVHERFISELIKQKLIMNIHEAQSKLKEGINPSFALYLPSEEIHELGLLFANYLILSRGMQTIYLGNNIPLTNLTHLLKHYNKITFLSYFTVKPDNVTVEEYIDAYKNEIGNINNYQLWLMGHKIQGLTLDPKSKGVTYVYSLKALRDKLSKSNHK